MNRALAVVFTLACSSPAKKAPPMDTCETALETFLAKDFAHWRGLPAGCTLATFGTKLEVGTDESRALLGSDNLDTTYWRAKAPTYPEVMKLWVRDGSLVRISVPLPELADPRALVRSFGEPEAKLDTYFQTTPTLHKQGEWVYAKRGLALVLSFDRSTVMELIVFSATTSDEYIKRLRFLERPRESPAE